jgi:hypothetical protein
VNLISCLGKVELVKNIIAKLAVLMRTASNEASQDRLAWTPLEVWDYFKDDSESAKSRTTVCKLIQG